MMTTTMRLLLLVAALLALQSLAFVPHVDRHTRNVFFDSSKNRFRPSSTSSLYLFDRFRKAKNKIEKEDPPVPDHSNDNDDSLKQQDNDDNEKETTPFFARFRDKKKSNDDNDDNNKEKTPLQQAEALRAQAERMRLEAEKMDAQLTLEKIERLEIQLAKAKNQNKTTDLLQEEMNMLQAKVRGEVVVPAVRKQQQQVSSSSSDVKQEKETATSQKLTTSSSSQESLGFQGIISQQEGLLPFNETEFQSYLKQYEDAPQFMKKTMANFVAVDYDDIKDVNASEVALRYEKMERKDYSWMDVPKPVFSKKTIADMEEKITKDLNNEGVVEDLLKKYAGNNMTALAVLVLENFYYEEKMGTKMLDKSFGLKVNDEGWQRLFEGKDDLTEGQQTAEALFPQSCRKQGETPTEEQIKILETQVLPKASFMPSSKVEPLAGGYIIRGTNKNSGDGDKLIEAIDRELAKSSVADKLSVFFIKDFTIYNSEEDLYETTPILYVTGPDVSRTRRPLLFTIVSAFGLATTWYLSVYPFLLNDAIMQKVDEQVALANANMDYDLDWLTTMASPLFLSFLGIQVAHEVGHRVAAAIHQTNVTVPTFVPSLVTGMTSTVTSFKSPPKNHKAMFDFAVAGPLTGIVASLATLYFGLQLTVFTDQQTYAAFPALPLEILRQSTLGGGLIEYFLGNGALSVPAGTEGSAAIASMKIALHPVAIAGYIGLVVNALSLVPIGTTDGGRLALALFGRGLKLVLGQIFLVILFFLGLFGSDLFLFYFSFVIFFQNGNEIPSRNEVDDLDFARVLVATAAGFLAMLTLIPMGY